MRQELLTDGAVKFTTFERIGPTLHRVT